MPPHSQESESSALALVLSSDAVKLGINVAWIAVKGLVLFFASLGIACLAYLLLYWILIPKVAHEHGLRINYPLGDGRFFYDQNSKNATASSNSIMAWADLSRNSFLQTMTSRQSYDVNVELLVPSSPSNIHGGNFMVSVKLLHVPEPRELDLINDEPRFIEHLGREGRTMYHKSQSAILPFKSRLLRLLELVVEMPLIMTGFKHEHQCLKIPIVCDITDNRNFPITHALVHVSPFIGSGSYVQIYSASIRIDAHFTGLRYLMYYMAVPSALVIVSMLTIVILCSLLAIWAILFSESSSQEEYRPKSPRIKPIPKEERYPSPAPSRSSSRSPNFRLDNFGDDGNDSGTSGSDREEDFQLYQSTDDEVKQTTVESPKSDTPPESHDKLLNESPATVVSESSNDSPRNQTTTIRHRVVESPGRPVITSAPSRFSPILDRRPSSSNQ
eukprot:Partr_v1_DN28944_c2_g1_i1_m25294 putative Berardinelli-Seip congenital lipodystrophy 2 (seipin)